MDNPPEAKPPLTQVCTQDRTLKATYNTSQIPYPAPVL
ncbi:hypothetical protein DU19_0661 [Chlamydia muridarum]|nr:hypothetical protein DU17_0663 [Chlamydia muridarum]KDU81612.1 hypothetical protein DU18_0660 [Chlamydia muridarum]KDU82131.1 hypothetical protein DU19_0661 [Chlamydia muridarum]KDU83568.1 hypothetical protein DU20_0662 [Chlamydia muridarum]KDU84099.1 hypothetical protein DU21_0663 [Chlamydia muridarum]